MAGNGTGEEIGSTGLMALPPVGDGIALWWCDLERRAAHLAHFASWLSLGEVARADRFGTPQLRARYVAGRTALRFLLAQHLHTTPAEVPLQRGRRGRPELAGDGMPDFNVSHTHDAALLGIASGDRTTRRIGVDVERLNRTVGADRLAHKFLTLRERHVQSTLPGSERVQNFLRYWTCKEALSKATGDGLIAPFGALEVELGNPPRLLEGPPPYVPEDWRLHAARVPDGYLGTIAVWTPGDGTIQGLA